MPEHSDKELLALCRMSPEAGFTALVEQYSRRIYWHVRRMVVSHEDSDDIVQNTFLKCWMALKGFRGESSLSTWLYTIATNDALMVLRKRKSAIRTDPDDIGSLLASLPEGDTWFDGDDAQMRFQDAILRLPEKQRLVFLLRYYDDMPYSEIAVITGTSEGALKSSYHHAVKKVEKFLSE